MSSPRVAVLGGGVIGLSVAWQLARRGHRVTVYDDASGRGASRAAAGMLSPGGEAWHGEEALVRLGRESLAAWPAFAADLESDAGSSPQLRRDGTLLVAVTDDDAHTQHRVRDLMTSHGITHRTLSRREVRSLEPALHPRLHTVTEVPDDHSVHNRALLAALTAAAHRHGVTLVSDRADVAVDDSERTGVVAGVRTRSDASTHPYDVVVVATGSALREVEGVPEVLRRVVRPVKGEILRVRTRAAQPVLTRTVRADVRGRPVYLVPRLDGEIVVGATTSERGYDTAVEVEAVHDLLHDAIEVVPELRAATFGEAAAGLRPSTPDHVPLVGPTPVDGLLLAAGHGRGGVLLAPWTAAAVAAHIAGEAPPTLGALTDPHRFIPTPIASEEMSA